MSIDDRTREFAYQIWESEGRPEGQQARHWEMARKLAEAEAVSEPQSVPRRRISKPKAVTLAEVEAEADKPQLLKKPRPRSSTAVAPAVAAKEPKAPKPPKAPKTPKV